MNVRLPNFLLVGAPKCGTTSIVSYMSQHPDIYITPIKEPKFFTAQVLSFPLRGPGDAFVENFTVKTYDVYKQLFSGWRHERAIGDASVDNLYFYQQVIPLIKHYLGDVKIIIMLRNPIDRAFSAYKNLLRDERETLDFESALAQEAKRAQQGYEYLWRYLDLGFYYRQVRAYMESFSCVKVFILEHFNKGSWDIFGHICRFLGVDPSFTPGRRAHFNASGRPRFRWMQRLFNPTGFKGKAYKSLALNGFNVDRLMRCVEPVRNINIRPMNMELETRKRLWDVYAPDVDKLAALLKTELTAWHPSDDPIKMITQECTP